MWCESTKVSNLYIESEVSMHQPSQGETKEGNFKYSTYQWILSIIEYVCKRKLNVFNKCTE